MHISLSDAKIIVACSAGAGLAAVYNIPFGGAMFALEVLLGSYRGNVIFLALLASIVSVMTARLGLGNLSEYHVHPLDIQASLTLWAILTGPLFGLLAFFFNKASTLMKKEVQHNWQVPLFCCINFFMIGVLAIYYPALLGNGRSPAEIEFNHAVGIELSLTLLILRILITLTSLRAGAHGGTLTPSLANGALLGVVLGEIWNALWTPTDVSTFAIVGAASFLAAAQRMPLSAIIIIFELTHVPVQFFIPVVCSVLGSVATFKLCTRFYCL